MDKTGRRFDIKKTWDELDPDKKKKVIVFSVIGLVLSLSLIAYTIRDHRSGSVQTKKEEIKKKDISLEPKLLEKSQYSEMQKTYKEIQESVKKINERVSSIETGNTGIEGINKDKAPQVPPLPGSPSGPVKGGREKTPEQGSSGIAVLPSPSAHKGAPPGIPPVPGETRQAKIETYGEIEIVSQRADSKEEKKGDKKKEFLKIYLPPSFMEATLLSGLDAPTSEGAQGQPAPVLVRIKDLAVLPNKVKANLKGCFLIAEGYGNLSDERAHLRLTNLSCLSKKGQAVIDQKIKGFVVDNDGKIGLRGKVVAKFGSKIAMGLVAGFFGGAGDALRTSATTTSISTLGTTQVIDTDQAMKAGIGGGLSQAAKDIQKFYLDLGKQSMPVVEVGAMKNITVVISEGVTLEVKERENACIGGRECDK